MSKGKILIIDDEVDLGVLLHSYFIKKGFDVYLSFTLEEGLILLKETHPDFLFLDNNLPDGIGWDAMESILENYPGTQLNLISAFRNELPYASSYVHIWEKPLDLKKLNQHFS